MLGGLLVFLLIVLALLTVPFSIHFHVHWPQPDGQDIRVRWAFGLVRFRVRPKSVKRVVKKAEPQPEPEPAPNRTHKRMSLRQRNALAVIWNHRFRARMMQFFGDLVRALRIRDFLLRVRIGLGDPADTGSLWAIVGPISGFFSGSSGGSVWIEPDFVDSTFELNSSGHIRIIPIQLIGLTVSLMLSPRFWSGLRQMSAKA